MNMMTHADAMLDYPDLLPHQVGPYTVSFVPMIDWDATPETVDMWLPHDPRDRDRYLDHDIMYNPGHALITQQTPIYDSEGIDQDD